ncbi:MAG: cytidine deaminase [Clostridiales bacterium]|nr:cytidine deaminase [Clostridiales bacterium]
MISVEELIKKAEEVQGEITLPNGLVSGIVGVALVTKDGNVYTGINVEFYCSLGHCAECSAISDMLKDHKTEIDMIVAVDVEKVLPPCGRCRELMMQVSKEGKDIKVILDKEGNYKRLEELLPEYWNTPGMNDYLEKDTN